MNRFQANICLFTVVVCWSFEFTLLSKEPPGLAALAIATLTNFIGFIVVLALFFSRIRQNITKALCFKILPLAILWLVYSLLYYEAGRYLSVDVSELCTTMTMAIVPILLSFLFFKPQPWQIWAGCALVMFGIFCSLNWSFPKIQTRGLYIMIVYCTCWAFYIVFMNRLAQDYDALTISALIMGMVGVIGAIYWHLRYPGTFLLNQYSNHFLASIFADAYFICIFANVLNIHTQRYVSPLDAIAIYALEPIVLLFMSFALPEMLVSSIDFKPANIVSCIFITSGAFICQADWGLLKKRLQVKRKDV